MFSVDYVTLSQIIQQFSYTGVFRAKVMASRALPEEGYIELEAKDGYICACYFIDAQEHKHKWDKWETRISRLGVLNWKLTQLHLSEPSRRTSLSPTKQASETTEQTEQASQAKQYALIIPYQTTPLFPSQLLKLPMLHRQIYSLVDGKRPIADIAHILHKSVQEIFLVITELNHQGYIQF